MNPPRFFIFNALPRPLAYPHLTGERSDYLITLLRSRPRRLVREIPPDFCPFSQGLI